jgi:L-seryl-tRNA(Ser) seleniumtransferase
MPKLRASIGDVADCTIIESTATVGGGALPLAELPGWAIALAPKRMSVNNLITRLRGCEPPVVGRVQDDRFLIDPRTLINDDETLLLQALQQSLSQD